MTEVLTWSVDLGHWFGVRVRIHYFLVFFALWKLLNAALEPNHPIVPTLAWLAILVVVLALHELAHALAARYYDVEPDEVRLWPLGNFTIPGPIRVSDSVAVAAAGVLTNLFLAIGTAFVLRLGATGMVFNPFGHYDPKGAFVDPGAPIALATGAQIRPFGPLWWLGWFGYLNWVVFLANCIPAYPLDGGRILRTLLARSTIGLTRDNPYTQWTARGFAGVLGLVAIYWFIRGPFNVGLSLLILAVLIELIVRTEVLMIENDGFFDDGIFGYDFSAGYTSLESSSPQVRPAREGTVKRWRRRRSEARVRRRTERQAAEEHRLDEILDKLHQFGRASLSDDEQRFLVQVSSRLRNKSQAGD